MSNIILANNMDVLPGLFRDLIGVDYKSAEYKEKYL